MKEILNIILKKEFIGPIVTVFVMWLIYLAMAKLIKKIFKFQTKRIPHKKQQTIMNFFLNMLRIIIVVIAILIILGIYGIDTKVIITSLGAVTVVIGLAFQDMLKDFIAGVSLVFENSYNVGDTVTINNFKGEVITIGIKATRLKSYDGNMMIINNGSVTEVINHTAANSLAIVDVGVSYDSDIEQVEKVLNELCKRLQKEIPESKGEISVLGIEQLGESSIVFRVTAEVEAGSQYAIQRQIRKEIKLEFDKNNIEIPYNQLVIHNA